MKNAVTQVLNRIPEKYSNINHDDADGIKISKQLHKMLYAKFEEAQFRAIESARKKEGLTLIQGPPGTGKTTTILGIISVLINT